MSKRLASVDIQRYLRMAEAIRAAYRDDPTDNSCMAMAENEKLRTALSKAATLALDSLKKGPLK